MLRWPGDAPDPAWTARHSFRRTPPRRLAQDGDRRHPPVAGTRAARRRCGAVGESAPGRWHRARVSQADGRQLMRCRPIQRGPLIATAPGWRQPTSPTCRWLRQCRWRRSPAHLAGQATVPVQRHFRDARRRMSPLRGRTDLRRRGFLCRAPDRRLRARRPMTAGRSQRVETIGQGSQWAWAYGAAFSAAQPSMSSASRA